MHHIMLLEKPTASSIIVEFTVGFTSNEVLFWVSRSQAGASKLACIGNTVIPPCVTNLLCRDVSFGVLLIESNPEQLAS